MKQYFGTTSLLIGFALSISCRTPNGANVVIESELDASADTSQKIYIDTASDSPNFTISQDVQFCTNLECQQVVCSNGKKTTVSGIVYDPAGKVPIYNAIVYVPNSELKPISEDVTCDQCAAKTTGNPLVSALTDATGSFVLDNVPVGTNIPLVIQIGKWRRQVQLPQVNSCVENKITNKELTRLPRNRTEGHIPKIALTTGGADPLECLLKKIGLDLSEFGIANSQARVHLYTGGGYTQTTSDGGISQYGASKFDNSLNSGVDFASAESLWSSVDRLKAYDIVLMSCEGQRNEATKTTTSLQAVQSYLSQGGRVFGSHYHDHWLVNGPAPFPSLATWSNLFTTLPLPNPVETDIVRTFPKGAALYQWLDNTGALTANGKLEIYEGKHNVDEANTALNVQEWITALNANTALDGGTPRKAVQYMTFNTPVEADSTKQCGRMVYSDLHVSSPLRSGDKVGQPFPTGCITQDLSPQEKALEFMLFDLSSCIQRDTDPPRLPPR